MASHIVQEKICRCCKLSKPISNFRAIKDSRGRPVVSIRCTACYEEHRASLAQKTAGPCIACGLVKSITQFVLETRHPERANTCKACLQVQRFWAKVEKTETCWVWTAARNRDGYGGFDHQRAHIFAWTLANGPIPKGQCVLHACDNPPCVRLDHLRLGTKKDNFDDMIQRQREAREFRVEQERSILTPDGVREARRLYATGRFTYAGLAVRFGVAVATMQHAIQGWTWKHVA